MPFADARGVKLYCEETGSGTPIVFVHEFGGDYRSWEPQVRFFGQRYRCITYNARGFPPSDVPEEVSAYSQEIAADDIGHVLDHLKIAKAHVVGLSMGGFATLHFGLRHPRRCLSLVVGGAGYGAEEAKREQFLKDTEGFARRFDELGSAEAIRPYAVNPFRVQFQNKDPRGWKEFADLFARHSAKGSANTLRGILKHRPSIFALEDKLRTLEVPTLIVTGDEDEPCLDPNLFMKRVMPWAGLWVMPVCGHTINLEAPESFNRGVLDFLTQVDAGRWPRRDPRSLGKSTLPKDA
ncbi:MAG: alpha/beta hydrolase [Proteobacteria bacterium]|nr:alpha/beta hydrolase [Pseudomonadota bacterium]